MTRDYSEYWSSLTVSHHNHPGNRFRYRLIARELASAAIPRQRVLDCGCGDGSLLSVVARTIACDQLHGMDVAANVPIQRAGVPIHFNQQDLGTPVPPEMHGRFDLVLCSEVIEHVADDRMVLRNLRDVTAPGGTLLLTTQSGTIYNTERFLGHLRHYRLADLCARMEEAGLKIDKAYLAGWPWLPLQKIAAHYFQGSVQKNIVQAKTLSPSVRALFFFLQHLYGMSSLRRGPQIVIVASKPAPPQVR
jgi:2-polyprenyl-3-methyl-5-hydroxy-6-metoxy-1,4-benzoquinol methylase